MKNLFCFDLTEKATTGRMDDHPYVTARVTPELEEQLDDVSHEAYDSLNRESETPGGKPPALGWKMWIGLILCVPAVVAAVAYRENLFESRFVLSVICLALMIAGAVLIRLAGRDQRKRMKEQLESAPPFDFSEGMEKLNRLSAEAHEQLSVPKDALDVDVLPFVYKRKGESVKSCYPADKFDNQPMLVWRRGAQIFFSEGRTVVTIPVEDIRGRITYDRPYTVGMWLKPVKHDEGQYKQYHIKSAGLLACRARTYYGIVIGKADGDASGMREILIPGYDWPQIEKLVQIPEMDPAG